MTTYAALLRGINVGGHKKVPMAELRALLGALGWTDVRTYLQSGNAVFTTGDRDPGPLLERALAERFGFEVRALIRTGEALRATAAACPFPADALDPSKLLVLFLDGDPGPAHFADLDAAAYAPDEFRHIGDVLYAYFPDGMGRSKLAAKLNAERPGATSTGRNWRTLRKLIELTR
ncbi:DUF1697 domain-containing protein [Streptomyces sp. NPDC054796]